MFFNWSSRLVLASASVVVVFATLSWHRLPISASDEPSTAQETSPNSEDNLAALLVWRNTPRLAGLPAAAEEVVASYDSMAADIRRRAANEIRAHRLQAMRRLKDLQDTHTRAAQLDEALAIRDTIRRMLEASFASIDNPGTMSSYANQVGKSYLIRVTGRTTGSVYGTEYFTYDSDLATACVHSGALRNGETGVVVVKMISAGEPHIGSVKHTVRSYDYGVYPASFTVRRWRPSLEEIELGSLKLE
jgi:hypothetical protein